VKETTEFRSHAEVAAWLISFEVIAAHKPLVIGARENFRQIAPCDVSHRALRKALEAHANSRPYLEALAAEGAQRHGLDGEPVCPVSEEDRAYALHRLGALDG